MLPPVIWSILNSTPNSALVSMEQEFFFSLQGFQARNTGFRGIVKRADLWRSMATLVPLLRNGTTEPLTCALMLTPRAEARSRSPPEKVEPA